MKNILVAYDGGEPARRALEAAVELAKRFDAPLAVVSVVPVHPGRSPIDPGMTAPPTRGRSRKRASSSLARESLPR